MIVSPVTLRTLSTIVFLVQDEKKETPFMAFPSQHRHFKFYCGQIPNPRLLCRQEQSRKNIHTIFLMYLY